ncbi:DinB family protein [Glycomyces buryatensis]|uniref:DinB family protein n=1 Tax=Glycomyces buryatensis TaxID=2570927 RepID=A0A4S8PUA7_9ACTN|nr:DinB family protein [Glycomyces buryatensis]THV33455.1 DinB family protein [Glycomyces buryatensis]
MTNVPKDTLQRYLQEGRDALLWKLDGLSEYDRRRPLTPTGTNLLGLVKHVAWTECEYLGTVFDRPMADLPWTYEEAEDNTDMWATADESTEFITDVYHGVWANSDATIAALDLEATGTVPWWRPESRTVTLHRILIHTIAETHRHAGHADIVRETIDGDVGMARGNDNLPPADQQWWTDYRTKLEATANSFR